MSNPVYRWKAEGTKHPAIPRGLPDGFLEQIARDPQTHATARFEARAELDRRRRGQGLGCT
jgi:hypothetical protein